MSRVPKKFFKFFSTASLIYPFFPSEGILQGYDHGDGVNSEDFLNHPLKYLPEECRVLGVIDGCA
jgi:hypothetical protein